MPTARRGSRPSRAPAVVAIIPARLASTRLPNKVLLAETGRPLIQHVAQAAARARSLARVVVAADDPSILAAVRAFGGEAVATRVDHPNGTSRLAEAARKLALRDDDLVVNVQGDEPEIEPDLINAAVKALRASDADVSTVAIPFEPTDDPSNPNIVKAVVAKDGRALYFSRARVPFVRDAGSEPAPPLRHVGLYVYRVGFLKTYVRLAHAPIERAESLEQLRVLWHGYQIQVAVRKGRVPAGIDTREQYDAFVARWRASEQNATRPAAQLPVRTRRA
jgi:3-deoxy-manno-octulosonate cytidylyltransferase (CMP-KDO synthetase)